MITVISATNRPHSNTLKIALNYVQLMEKQGVECQLFSLENLPADFIATDLYGKRSENFQQLLDKFILPADKLVFIVPEYNGSFPGVLKSFLDSFSPDINRGKKVAMVGVATGRSGNVRGMEHLTGILNYLGMYILPDRMPISGVMSYLDGTGLIKDENLNKLLEKHIESFVAW